MLIGNKIFPYPVLNNNASLSGYDSPYLFSLKCTTDTEGKVIVQEGNILLKDLHYDLSCATLQKLIDSNKAECVIIVECPSSTYRKSFPITQEPTDLFIPAKSLHGAVNVSCFIYASDDIKGFQSDEFIEDLKPYSFDIDKFDILAADDGFRFIIEINEEPDNKVSSIFSIAKTENAGNIMAYENLADCIIIKLSPEYYACYENIKTNSEFNNIAFSMIAIPVLSACIEELQTDDYNSFDEILEQKKWFNAVLLSYKRDTGMDLQYEEFWKMSALKLAQQVLNYASCEGIKAFDKLIVGLDKRVEEDE